MSLRKSITAQIAVMMVLISLLPLGGVAWYLNAQKSAEIWESQTDSLNLLYRKSIELIETAIGHQKELLQTMAQNPHLMAEFTAAQRGEPVSGAFEAYLTNLIQGGDYHDFLMIDPKGEIFYTAIKESDLGRNLHSRAFRNTSLALGFERTAMLLETEISPLRYYAPSDRAAIFITTPLIHDNRFVGVLAVQLNEGYLYSLVNSNEGFGRSGEIVTAELREDGAIVATIPLRHNPDAVADQMVLAKTDEKRGLAAALRGEYGLGVATDYRGVETMAVWGFIPSLRWGIMIKTDLEELYAPLRQSNRNLLAWMLAVVVALIGVIAASTRLISRPILQLSESVKRFSSGEVHTIDPIRAHNEIGLLSRSFSAMAEEIDHQMRVLQDQAVSLEEQAATLEEQTEEIERQNATLEEQVKERTAALDIQNRKVSALLDHSGQGFLSFGADRLVDEEYSKECENLFRGAIAHRPVDALLFEGDPKKRATMEKTLELYFGSTIAFQQECLIALLPQEAQLFDRVVRIEYRPIGATRLMAILTDITAQRSLEERIAQERRVLSFITMVLRNKNAFLDALYECESHLKLLCDQARSDTAYPLDRATKLYRKIHTYKGVFLQFSMPTLPARLHPLESSLWEAIVQAQTSQSPLKLCQKELQAAREAIKTDRGYLQEALGEAFLSSEHEVVIPESYLEALEGLAQKIQSLLTPDQLDSSAQQALAIIKNLRRAPFKGLLSTYPNLCMQLANRLHKEIEPFEIQGSDLWVDPREYGDFTKALIHIFRNAIDHGIEDPATREACQKPQIAQIGCHLSDQGENLCLEVRDDGRGLDEGAIVQRALDLGLIDPDRAAALSPSERLELIFMDGFSTKEETTDLSGRGVGLSALKEEVLKLGGRIEVASIQGQGTCFRFYLPKERT